MKPQTAFRKLVSAAFPDVKNGVISAILLVAMLYFLASIVGWVVIRAVWEGTPQDCLTAAPQGACWAMIPDKLSFIAIGRFSVDERWRPISVILSFVTLIAISPLRRFWGRGLFAGWLVFFIGSQVLMYGGLLGLSPIPSEQWGGLVLTIVLSTTAIAISLPVGTVLALGRRSKMPAVRMLSIGYIEVIRGVPLITILFLSSVMLPLVVPAMAGSDKVSRAWIAISLFAAAYVAEIVRGGIQTIPEGQLEAARSLGLGYFGSMYKIILPQAFQVSVPPLVNGVVAIFKDTSLVLVIGLVDFLSAIRIVASDPHWRLFYVEEYGFAAAVYFLFCLYVSRIGASVERQLRIRFS